MQLVGNEDGGWLDPKESLLGAYFLTKHQSESDPTRNFSFLHWGKLWSNWTSRACHPSWRKTWSGMGKKASLDPLAPTRVGPRGVCR